MMGQEMHSGGMLLWMLIVAVIMVIPFWRICSRVGYPGVLGLLILLPIVNVVFVYFLAFSRWPREPEDARSGEQ